MILQAVIFFIIGLTSLWMPAANGQITCPVRTGNLNTVTFQAGCGCCQIEIKPGQAIPQDYSCQASPQCNVARTSDLRQCNTNLCTFFPNSAQSVRSTRITMLAVIVMTTSMTYF